MFTLARLCTMRHCIGLGSVWVMALTMPCSAHARPPAHVHAHAHVHGQIQLGVAVDGKQVSVDIDTPLESLLGFEHTPQSAAQKKRAADWAQRLGEGHSLLRFTPEAKCKLLTADLAAPVLGLGKPAASGSRSQDDGDHADLEGQWTFECAAPEALRALEVSFFQLSPHARVVEVQWVKGHQQGKLTLKRPQSRISLVP
jgi:Protein of unknown function (DUF2796)